MIAAFQARINLVNETPREPTAYEISHIFPCGFNLKCRKCKKNEIMI